MNSTPGHSLFIPGVYNYCFRWCERCPFTARCVNFDLLEQMEGEEASQQQAPVVMRTIPIQLDVVINDLQLACERAGYDWVEVNCDIHKAEPTAGELKLREVSEVALRLSMQLIEWMNIYRETEPKGRAEWREAMHVLNWYGLMVGSKVQRAIGTLIDRELGGHPENAVESIISDANASAKLAALLVVRALAALSVMLRQPAPFEEELLTFTLDLLRIQQALRHHFPLAAAFERPGFDDPEFQEIIEVFYDYHLPIDPYRDGPWQTTGGRAPQD